MTRALSLNTNPAPETTILISEPGKSELGDLRFRALLSNEAWVSLPPAVRRRFSKRLAGGAAAIYTGRVTDIRISRLGRALAQILRIIGAPLPLSSTGNASSVVTVTEDAATGGQNWTRLFTRGRGFPQIIHSVKRFSGPTGLEEYIGFGIAMALAIGVESSVLVFRSQRYCLAFRNWRMPLPRWASPGKLTVSHKEVTPTSFMFTLHLEHKFFGTLVHQEALYDEERL
jgi:Domain of unknown function (DUF4166)